MSDISQLSSVNPYKNQQYHETGWQRFLSSLGFRTEADAWKENMAVQAAEYDAALAQKKFDTEYESASEQVSRMRQAGLNPDLDPSSVGAGEAAPMGDDPSTPMQSSGATGTLMEVANGVMNAFTTSLGIVSSFQGIFRSGLENSILNFDRNSKVTEFAEKMFPYLIPSLGESAGENTTKSDIIDSSLQLARIFSRKNLPRSYRGKFENAIRGFWSSAPADAKAYEAWSNRISQRRSYYVNQNTLYDEFSELLMPIARELGQMNSDVIKLQKKSSLASENASIAQSDADVARSKNEKQYFESLDPSLQAGAENASNAVTKQNMQMTDILRKHVSQMIDKLESASHEGGAKGAAASVMMSLLSVLQLWISTQGMPSVSRSSSSTYSATGRGVVDKSQSSFSLGF